MFIKLSQLAEREDLIRMEVEQIPWDTQVTDDPKYATFYDQYKEIHRQYASLADFNSEAMKRAVFIQWYAMSEPSPLSGIGDLDPASMLTVMSALDKSLDSGQVDEEMSWMLSHYINVMEYPFVQFPDLPSLHGLVTRTMVEHQYPIYPESIDRVLMSTRGGMGHYWNSMSIY